MGGGERDCVKGQMMGMEIKEEQREQNHAGSLSLSCVNCVMRSKTPDVPQNTR